MKPKAKTLIERLGFIDPDRKSSLHDEIQIWTSNNICSILRYFAKEPGTEFIIHDKRLEYPVISNQVIGFIDLYLEGYISTPSQLPNTSRFHVALEVKSSIESYGDLVRQINFYRHYDRNYSTWIVVSPDARFEIELKEQGIWFYKYPIPLKTSSNYKLDL